MIIARYITRFSIQLCNCVCLQTSTHSTRETRRFLLYIHICHARTHAYVQDTKSTQYTNKYKSTTRRIARTRFRMGLQIPLYQQPERHYERRATPPQPDRTSKVCLPSNPETKANCPFLIQAFVNTKLNVFLRINISIYARLLLPLTTVVSFVVTYSLRLF